MFPKAYYTDVHSAQRPSRCSIARSIARDLQSPKSRISFGDMTTFRAAMPKTTVHENRNLSLWKDDIGFSWKVVGMQFPTTDSGAHQCHPKRSFCTPGVLTPD
jgi:hypothetical protein